MSWDEWGPWVSCGTSDCGPTVVRSRRCYSDPTNDVLEECDRNGVEYRGCDIESCDGKGREMKIIINNMHLLGSVSNYR